MTPTAEEWDSTPDVFRLAMMAGDQTDLWRARRFALALCRRDPAALSSPKGRRAIATLEEIYDRPPAKGDTNTVFASLMSQQGDGIETVRAAILHRERNDRYGAYALCSGPLSWVRAAATAAASAVVGPAPEPAPPGHPWHAAFNVAYFDALRPAADLFRCVFANPFRRVEFDPKWRTSTVVGLACAAHGDWGFDRLPILADALQDAGCEDEHILAHCRSGGSHARGCWVVEVIRK